MKRKIEITYNYNTSELPSELKLAHVGEMEDNAVGHILEMMIEGFTSGELCYGIRTNPYNEDINEEWPEIEVNGWWSINTFNIDEE